MNKKGEEAIQTTDVEAADVPVTEEVEKEEVQVDPEAEAIQGEDVDEPTEVEQPRLRRDQTMDEIVAASREARNQEIKEHGLDEVAEEEAEPEPVAEDPDKKIIELKVDGKIVKKTQAEVNKLGGIEAAQKTLSAQYRLDRAAEEQLRVSQREDALLEKERELDARQTALEQKMANFEKKLQQPPQEQKKSKEELRESASRFISDVYSGKEEDALKHFEEALERVSVPQKDVNVEEIVQNATVQAVFETERNLGKREFLRQYPHLASDKNLAAMTNRETGRLLKEHPEMSPYDIIMTAAQNIDTWAKGVKKDEPEAKEMKEDEVDKEIEARDTKKKTQQTIKPASTRVVRNNEYRPKTQEQIMAEYRKTRHR